MSEHSPGMTESSFVSCVLKFQKYEKAHTAATESSPRSYTQSERKIMLQTENNWLRKKHLSFFNYMNACLCVSAFGYVPTSAGAHRG